MEEKLMPSHLSDIGFDLRTEAEFNDLVLQTFQHGEWRSTDQGIYLRWAVGEGVELWGQMDQEENFIGLNPHFTGDSFMRVGLTTKLERPESSTLDGAFRGWASPDGEDAETGLYPFIFDVPDFRCVERVELPSIAEVQLTAFAHELTSFDNDEAYYASQAAEHKFAAESFIPVGSFSEEDETENAPQAYAWLAGHVLESALRTNPVTQNQFLWIKVQSFGGVFDIVADPVLVSGMVVQGGVVSGTFWLSGRLQKYVTNE
jgi:hypothetical protein